MASTSRVTICDLPNGMMLSIFSFLPVADLARCAATCEHWHRIVTACTDLWKGKRYQSIRNPTECAETRAVLHALPPLHQVIIGSGNGFNLNILYPYMALDYKYIRDLNDCPRLRCEYLETSLDIAWEILYHRSSIDFGRLRHLELTQRDLSPPNVWDDYSAEYVVWASLSLCPNLKTLYVCAADFRSEEYLDVIKGCMELQSLNSKCPGFQELSIMQHCSGGLEELELADCTGLPVRELANLPRLQNLRELRMSECSFKESDLATAVAGLANLEVLGLRCCSLINNLSFLQQCKRLQELYITTSDLAIAVPMVTPATQWMDLLRLPSWADDVTSLCADYFTLTAVSLPAAMRELEKMGMSRSCLDYLGALCSCTYLTDICCEFARGHPEEELKNVWVHIILKSST